MTKGLVGQFVGVTRTFTALSLMLASSAPADFCADSMVSGAGITPVIMAVSVGVGESRGRQVLTTLTFLVKRRTRMEQATSPIAVGQT